MWWRSREKSWRENKMRLQTKKTCCSKTWVCFYSKAVREFYTDMKDVPTDHPDFQRAIKVLAFRNIANLRGPPWRPVKKAHASGGGIKPQSSGNSFCIFFFFFFDLLMYEKRWKDACQSTFLSWNWRSYTPNGWFKIPPDQKTNFNSEVNG